MSAQMAEIVGMSVANEVRDLGGNEEQVRDFFLKSEAGKEQDVLRRFARALIRAQGGTVKRSRKKSR